MIKVTTYVIPAVNGKPAIDLPNLVETDKTGKKKIPLVKKWVVYNNFIVIETKKEIEDLKDYKI